MQNKNTPGRGISAGGYRKAFEPRYPYGSKLRASWRTRFAVPGVPTFAGIFLYVLVLIISVDEKVGNLTEKTRKSGKNSLTLKTMPEK